MGRGIVLALVLGAALTACGDASSRTDRAAPSVPAASPTGMLPAAGPVRTVTTVLDDGDGPVMCLSGMAWSTPPECEGPAVTGWDWTDHPDAQSADGVRWGSYVLVGSWDGTSLAVSEARASTPDDHPAQDVGDMFASRCVEPEGGWVPVDPVTTTRQALAAGHRAAEELPDYAISWGDQSINPHWEAAQDLDGGEGSLEIERAMNDPRYTVLNVAVTDDLARAEDAVRAVWGGALCVTELANTHDRLREVAEDLRDLPGNLTPQFGTISNRVELPVVHDDGSIQAWVDEAYGEGVVDVTSALQPVEQ